ncbi:MAG: mycofactocin system transcriptional regulator [Nocardioides sp.]|nr:mycofactocin system transcriptional regulator [Nocardioides sp.]
MTPERLPAPSLKGRPVATTHGEIESAAFRLFAERGFESTTLADIAREVGVGRRTLFRYFSSKNDIAWGQFDTTLEGFRQVFQELPEDLPVHEAVRLAVRSFNDLPEGAQAQHRARMRLILETPALQAHSVLRYAEWRAVIMDYVARRHGLPPGDLLPRTVGHVALAVALAAYEAWLDDEDSVLGDLLDEALADLRRHLAP